VKGPEFTFVFVPDRDQFPKPQQPSESYDAYLQRAQRERRQVFVAVTRARDGLWLDARGGLARLRNLCSPRGLKRTMNNRGPAPQQSKHAD
jgi:hypothetical protein